jgi:hypothetical protein
MKTVVILVAVAGPVTGRRIEVPAGSLLRVGRTDKSECAIAEDPYLSGQHFSIEHTTEPESEHTSGERDGTLLLRDLGSSNGTFVNGESITEAEVKEGDSVAAGGTTFQIHVERAAVAMALESTQTQVTRDGPASDLPALDASPAAGTPGAWRGFSSSQSALLRTLYRDPVPVFAFLDPARDARIPAFLDASREHYERVEETLAPSPLLVTLPPASKLLDVLVKDGWGRGWGFYFTSTAGFEELRLHWRSYVMLRSERGREITFRFWDPHVLRAILPAMPASEAREFLGPVARLIVEGDRAEEASEFSWSARGARERVIALE